MTANAKIHEEPVIKQDYVEKPRSMKILFTVEEAAERLGVHKTWLYERTRKKAIPFRKLGKYVRFSEADLQAIALGGIQ